jgi:hypothetical protein
MARKATEQWVKANLTPAQYKAWKAMSPKLSLSELKAGKRPPGTRKKKKAAPRKGKRKMSAKSKAAMARLDAAWERAEARGQAPKWETMYSNPRKGRRVKKESIHRAARAQLGGNFNYMHGPSDDRAIQALVSQGFTIKDAVRMHYLGNPKRRRKPAKKRSYKRNCGWAKNPPRDSKGRFKKVRKSRSRRRR